MYKYAILSENNTVTGVSYLSGAAEAPNMILLNDETPERGDIYDNGKFVKPETGTD